MDGTLKNVASELEEKVNVIVSDKVGTKEFHELLNEKSSKYDYGELYKLYSKLYIALDPLINNQGML